MNITLIRIDAQDAAGGAVPVFLSSHDLPQACHIAGEQWQPALATLPEFALDFFGGGFSGQVTAPRTRFTVATIGLPAFGPLASARARFADAQVQIWVGEPDALVLRFDGRITGEPEVDEAARAAKFDAAVQDSWADDPLLTLFAGTDGIEGPVDLTGQSKPLALGNIRFGSHVLIDNIDNVYMVSNGPVQAVNAAYDRLLSLGPSTGDFPDLAALIAADIPNGSWGTCLALGLVRLAAPPDGRVSFDISGSNAGTGGYVRLPGGVIRRVADLAGGTVNAASLTALDVARPYNLQLHLREQATAREVIAQLADSVAAVAGVSLTGELFAQPLVIAGSGEALNADGSSALAVIAVEELAKAAPAWRLATQAEPTFELHSPDEAAFSYRWQGEFSLTRVYRTDDVVTGPDSAAWAYINPVPAAGEVLPVWPATANAHWRIFQVPGSAAIAPANANRVPFSRMEGDRGWAVLSNSTPTPPTVSYGTLDGLRFFRVEATATAADQAFSFGTGSTPAFTIADSERLSVQARVELQGAGALRWQLELWTFEPDGVTQSQTAVVFGDAPSSLTGALPNVQAFVDVPAGRVSGRLELRIFTGAAGALQAAISEPMVTSAAPSQTVHPSFTAGPNADDAADVTATAQRTIVPQFPIIEINQGEAGHTGDRVVLHIAKRGTAQLLGGTWSLPSQSLGAGTASIGASTGVVTLSGIIQSGSYTVRYTHTDGIATDLAVNVTFFAAPAAPGGSSDSVGNLQSINSTSFAVITPRDLEITLPGGDTDAVLTAQLVALNALPESPFGATDIEFRLMNVTGTPTIVGATQASSPSPTVGFDAETSSAVADQGSITINRTASGLGAGSTQKFRLEARISGGNTRTIFISGTVQAAA